MKAAQTILLAFIALLTISISACKSKVEGCTDPLAINYNSEAEVDDGSCTYTEGCTDPTATNYDPDAVVDDGSCIYPPDDLTDSRDGKTYKTVQIGTQIWMAENLNYDVGAGSYCYDDSPSNCTTYGKLYTWDAAQTACPAGWHLPSEIEFQTLITSLGGNTTAGPALKPGGLTGFNALYAGTRITDGTYAALNAETTFWSATQGSTSNIGIGLALYIWQEPSEFLDFFKAQAVSCRCIKD